MTIGLHAPLPPARTGVADYAQALLAALGKFGRVLPLAVRADVHLYHLGNNSLHRGIYQRALERPGVAVLHDAVLHHFLLGWMDREEYVREFTYNYGSWYEDLARSLWEQRARAAASPVYYCYPMLRRIAERSLGLVVHNPAAALMVQRHLPTARTAVIPHPWVPETGPPEARLMRLRQQAGFEPRAFLLGVFGYLRESKRLLPVVRCALKLREMGVETGLVLAGRFVSAELHRALEPVLRQPWVRWLGWLGPAALGEWLAAVDVCVNLRYPSAGETSGIAIRAMGLGRPVVLTDSLENAGFPEGTCIRVAPGLAEEEELAEHLLLLAGLPHLGRQIGEQAAEYVRREHHLDRVAERYWRCVQECCAAAC